MSQKHTPGPWRIVGRIIIGLKEKCICEIAGYGIRHGKADAANASLIAAAPDLLEALKAIVKSLADQDDEGLIEHAQQMIDARAAIAKATGGAI